MRIEDRAQRAERKALRVTSRRPTPTNADEDLFTAETQRSQRIAFFVCRETTTNKNMSPLGNTALVKTLRGELTADLRRLKSEHEAIQLRAKFQSKFTIKRTWSENILLISSLKGRS